MPYIIMHQQVVMPLYVIIYWCAKWHNFPIFISEWGTSESSGDGNFSLDKELSLDELD